MPQQYHPERGNILFYILIAIVAFAALSFAISRGGRESASTIDREKVDLAATEILDYATALRGNIQNMSIQGVKQNQLCFDHASYGTAYQYAACSSAKNKVFDSLGGGAPAPRTPSPAVLVTSQSALPGYGLWSFPRTIQIKGVGTDCSSPTPGCNELVAIMLPLRDDVCRAINKKMAIDNPDNLPVNISTVTYAPYLGSFVYDSVIDPTTLIGKRTGCFRDNSGINVFYAVLIAN